MKTQIKLDNNEIMVVELSDEQLNFIYKQQELNKDVPLYLTTYAKSKYGDSKVGNIKSIKIIK